MVDWLIIIYWSVKKTHLCCQLLVCCHPIIVKREAKYHNWNVQDVSC